MVVTAIIIGMVLIGTGFLIRACPDLCAGYNTMSKEKKANVDIKGLSVFLFRGMTFLGALLIAGCGALALLRLGMITGLFMLMVSFLGVGVMVMMSWRYDGNVKNRSRYILPICIFLIAAASAILIVSGYMPSKITVTEDKVHISGTYGVDLSSREMSGVELIDELPYVIMRTNGSSAGNMMKGYFSLEDYGRSRLFVRTGHGGPFIVITDTAGLKTIFNTPAPETTAAYFDQIRGMLAF